jgi:hypothetical protein
MPVTTNPALPFCTNSGAAAATVDADSNDVSALHIAAFIGTHLHSRQSSAKFFARSNANLQDPELTALEHKRGKVILDAISEVMPKAAIEHDLAARAFLSPLTGNIIVRSSRASIANGPPSTSSHIRPVWDTGPKPTLPPICSRASRSARSFMAP